MQLRGKGNHVVRDIDDAMLGDGHPVRVSAQVIEHLLRATKRRPVYTTRSLSQRVLLRRLKW